jgi:hypothetical protein
VIKLLNPKLQSVQLQTQIGNLKNIIKGGVIDIVSLGLQNYESCVKSLIQPNWNLIVYQIYNLLILPYFPGNLVLPNIHLIVKPNYLSLLLVNERKGHCQLHY